MHQGGTLLFIPAYNCEKQIGRVLRQIDEGMRPHIDEVIVVDNRSTDGTAAVVLANLPTGVPAKLLRNDENYGLGGSHKVAFSYALENGFSHIVVLHGDDQGDLHDLLPILQNPQAMKRDGMLGARFMKGSRLEGYSGFRTIGNKAYNLLFSICLGMRVFDLGSGLNLYAARMLKHPFYMRFPDNLMFNYCMVLAARYYRHDMAFFPISWRETDQISNVKLFNQAFRVLRILLSYVVKPRTIENKEFRDKPITRYTFTEQGSNLHDQTPS